LRVLCVNEPGLAEAINRLRGEWEERSGGELTASDATWADVQDTESIEADLVIFPSRYLGDLCVRDLLRPVRPNVLDSDEVAAAEIFPIVREQLMKWGGRAMALPLGLNPMRDDEVARHPALALLARAAPKADATDRIGVLFDWETMKPQITEQPFVDALSQLVQSPAANTPELENAPIVPVLGYSDRLAAVTSSSRNTASAFKLLAWLAQAETSSQLATAAGGATIPVRSSTSATTSMRAEVDSEHSEGLQASLGGERCLIIPRVPGVDDYIAALDAAVNGATRDKVGPQAALQEVDQRWEEITDARGREKQRLAYLKHLNLDEP
jgi:hypothetical protein